MTVHRCGLLAMTLLASACSGAAPTIEAITVVNGTNYDLGVDVTDEDREAWLPLATVEAQAERTSEEVIDQGNTWIFRFIHWGEPIGELSLSRSELERDGWRVEVPQDVAERLTNLGRPPSRWRGESELDERREVCDMPSADAVRAKALTLTGRPNEEAVRELLEYCGDKRVSVVLARQELQKELVLEPAADELRQAAELLDEVLGRLPLA
jgi:hypothetical protein